VRDRIFAMQKGNVKGARPSLWMKAPAGFQEALVARDSSRFFVPPYVGKQGWIGVWLDGRIDWSGLGALIEESFWMTAPKRLGAKKPEAPKRARKASKR
jgi:predicted DNA-binding protein (MmcQ/YjbR family)